MTENLDLVRSATGGIVWPALPSAAGALQLALQYQLARTQWWAPAELERAQFRQLGLLLRHAFETVPFYGERLAAAGFRPGEALTRGRLAAIPVVTRREVQERGDALHSRGFPPTHGDVGQGQTSGSTGRPLAYLNTAMTRLLWQAFTLRDQLWHRRDFSATMAGIRPQVDEEKPSRWGPSVDTVFAAGRSVVLNVARHDLDEQLEWLARQAPAYLVSNASNLYSLARRSLERGVALPSLREACIFGGALPEDARELVRQAWNVPLTDVYTAEEVGYIALQCPDSENYHVQAEGLIVEILDERGRGCGPGEIGRVVLSTLHNYAMPLIRYEIGDYAEVGAPCPCGRGLPVLNRILGRQRNMLTLPGGAQRWPSFPSKKWSHVAPVRQVQLVQKSTERIVVRVVAGRALTVGEEQEFLAALASCLGYPFAMELERVDEIPRSASHKFEDFISEVI